MIIEVNHVSMIYPVNKKKKILALNDISYAISCGEIVGLIGLNGAGKSSLIKLMTGIIKPTQGEIIVMGEIPFNKRKKICSKYGAMFGQRSQLWWDLPVKDSFYVNGSIYGMSKKQIREKIYFYEEWLNLNYFDIPVRKLSLGQRVMCDILISMLHEPEILFLDEGTIALDVFNRRKILEMIIKINREFGTTIIMTSHQLDDIESVCNRILLLNKGSLYYDGKLKDFIRDSKISKAISIQAIDIDTLEKELLRFVKRGNVYTIRKEYELSLFVKNNEKLYEEIVQFLSKNEKIDSFLIREVTLEERIMLI